MVIWLGKSVHFNFDVIFIKNIKIIISSGKQMTKLYNYFIYLKKKWLSEGINLDNIK